MCDDPAADACLRERRDSAQIVTHFADRSDRADPAYLGFTTT
jgi:hypothetical protein